MERYYIEEVVKEGFKVIVLRDSTSNSHAEMAPEIGSNLFSFESGGHQILEPPLSLEALKNQKFAASKFGNPLLFPPNRIKNGTFVFKGKSYKLPLNEPPDNHLHGEISSLAWKVIEKGVSREQGAYVTSRFRFDDHPEIMQYFPHPLIFTVTCRLYEGRLSFSGAITNEGINEAPFAFGLHPYFSLPFGSGESMVLKVPAEMEWPISAESFVRGKPEITELTRKLNEGLPIGELAQLSCSLLTMKSGDSTCHIKLNERKYTIFYHFSRIFPYLVLFRPDWSQSFSLEPYTYVTDAFNLPFEEELTGVRGIAAKETITFETSMWMEAD